MGQIVVERLLNGMDLVEKAVEALKRSLYVVFVLKLVMPL